MNDLTHAVFAALRLLLSGDPTFVGIVILSINITVAAVILASACGLPLGDALAVMRFPGRSALVVLINGFMGLPPVVASCTAPNMPCCRRSR